MNDQPCDNCCEFFDAKPIWTEVREQTSGPRGFGIINTHRVFCSETCESEFRLKWEYNIE